MAADEGDPEEDSGGSGGASLAGYEYQIDVSVWLALELVLVSALTPELVLEPASQEDLEGELAATEPGIVVSRLPMTGYTLVVQVKQRSGNAWTPKTLRSLLAHGSAGRPSAATRLATATVRYLLVTSAGLNGEARRLSIRRAGNWPNQQALPTLLADLLPSNAAGRVAVIANEDDERLDNDISRLLAEGCRVPNARLTACRRTLRDEARLRIAGAGGGRWARDDLERVIKEHGGYLASSRELDGFVHPINWPDLRAMIKSKNAALIIGQSGTGKSLSTLRLYDELHAEIGGLERVLIRLGPHQLRDDRTPDPVLFDIEDPWGRFDFDPNSRPWNDQLAGFLASASPNRMIIATSRLDVAQASKALDSVKPWLVKLEAEHYGKDERARLYRSRIDGLPRELQPLASGAQRRVLDELATPLEIQKFFDALRTLDREGMKNPPAFLTDAIGQAHQDAIEGTVVNQIEQRGDVRASAVIWGLLKASDKLSRSVLRLVEDGMADLDPLMERGVSPLVDFFAAARNLRQSDGGVVTYYHPRVEAGVEQAMTAQRGVARSTLRRLVGLLVSEDGPAGDWGAGAAARLLAAAHDRFDVTPSASAAMKIDAWLEARLAEGGNSLEDNLVLAAAAGSSHSNGSEVSRYLLHRPDRGFPGFRYWGPPARPDAWYAARCADPTTKPLIEAFVRGVLPTDRVSYPASFAGDLERLAPDLSDAFLDVAARIVGFGYIESDDVIAEGALRDLEGFEKIVDLAVKAGSSSDEERTKAAELRLEVENEVYSDDYGQHVLENDDGFTASEFLKAYLLRFRAVRGWRPIVQHRHAIQLLPYWLTLLRGQSERHALDWDEFRGAFQFAYGSDDEDDLWVMLRREWKGEFLPALRDRIAAGSACAAVSTSALQCLVDHVPDELGPIAQDLAIRNPTRLAEIAIELSELRGRRSRLEPVDPQTFQTAVQAFPSPYGELIDAASALDSASDDRPILSEEAHAVLATFPGAEEKVRLLRVGLGTSLTPAIEADILWLLAEGGSSSTALSAAEAAVRLGMLEAVEKALDSKFARVSALALTTLGQHSGAPLPPRLLDKVSDRPSPVRKALLALLLAMPHPDHLPTLLTLSKDEWSPDSRNYGHDDDFPIAREAVSALGALAPLPLAAAKQLFATGADTSDPDLRQAAFKLLASTGGALFHERLLDLAIQPGRAPLRKAAAFALLQNGELLAQEVVDRITEPLISTRIATVAAVLALLLGWRGEVADVRATCEALATNSKRRVFILLLIWMLNERHPEIADELAALLPADHPAVRWALGGINLPNPDDALVADLGDPTACAQVLIYMRSQD